MRTLIAALLLGASSAWAGGPLIDNSTNQKQVGVQVQKAAAQARGEGGSVIMPAGVKQNFPVVVASANAHQPSAQCRYGIGAQLGVQEFGFGLSASQWDEICGLWMAAQLTTGDASDQAATAAYCLTFKKAGVSNATCADWDNGQNMAMAKQVEQGERSAHVVFGGSGSGGWN